MKMIQFAGKFIKITEILLTNSWDILRKNIMKVSLKRLEIIFEMKSTLTGSDCINLLTLKTAFPIISKVFTSLINACLKQGKFPKCLKIARLTPVFKGGNKNDLGNYWSISLLPVS